MNYIKLILELKARENKKKYLLNLIVTVFLNLNSNFEQILRKKIQKQKKNYFFLSYIFNAFLDFKHIEWKYLRQKSIIYL